MISVIYNHRRVQCDPSLRSERAPARAGDDSIQCFPSFETSVVALIGAQGELVIARKASDRDLHLNGQTHRIAPNRKVFVIGHNKDKNSLSGANETNLIGAGAPVNVGTAVAEVH